MSESGTIPSATERRTLGEARTYFGNPDIVAELNALAKQGYGDLRQLFWPLHRNIGEERFRVRMRQLEDDQMRELTEGSLITDAYNSPWWNNSPHVIVPSDMWPSLQRDFDKSGATGDGIKLIQVRVWRPNSVEPQAISPLPAGTRLNLYVPTRTIQFDGHTATFTKPTFDLLLWLAQRGQTDDPFISSNEVHDRWFSDQAGEGAVRDLVRKLRDQLELQLGNIVYNAPDIIQNRKKLGYKLALPPEAVRIEGSNRSAT
jgi:hypothetical protein